MISATTFATRYTSLWQSLTPNSEQFVRRLNLNLERFRNPLDGGSAPSRRGFLNEIAFQMARRKHEYRDLVIDQPTIMETAEVVKQAFLRRGNAVIDKFDDPSALEYDEILRLTNSIANFCNQHAIREFPVKFGPHFLGCGIVDSSEGDVLMGECLYEFKAGDRSFRTSDLRQLLTYCALNFASHQFKITSIGAVNPRHGTFFALDIETVAFEMSNKSPIELLSEIVYFVSGGTPSR